MPKPKRATKKSLPASRRRAIKHPPLTTFNGAFTPSNAWHLKLGIEDGRAAVAFVVIVGVLALGLVATLLGWAKTVSDLRSEVAMLRSEFNATKTTLARISSEPFFIKLVQIPGNADQQLVRVNVLTGEAQTLLTSVHAAAPMLPPGVVLEHISTPSGSGAAFFALRGFEAPTGVIQPILRFDLASKKFTALRHGTMSDAVRSYAVSPDGHYVALYALLDDAVDRSKTSNKIVIANLDRDISTLALELVGKNNFCDFETELYDPPELLWSGADEIRVKTCSHDRRGDFHLVGFTTKIVTRP